jgi:malonyl-CoA decarboxylase
MSLLADLLSTLFERKGRVFEMEQDRRNTEELAAALVSVSSEISGLSLALQILERFGTMEDQEKSAFFHHLSTEMAIAPDTIYAALTDYQAQQTRSTYQIFMAAAEPPRQELIRRLNQVPGGTGRLVAMRADLLRLGSKEAKLQALDLDFRHLFSSWFNRGFLVLRPINWESPAHILEKIIDYEAVHTIESWDDLRRRLKPTDRRCFAFFHPAMPDEPLIFVEVALTRDVPNSIQALLAEERTPISATEADTAVFYSISNCQAGLASISFGNSLIKQVVNDLAAELPNLKTFVTLSPIPGLAGWAEEIGQSIDFADPESLRRLAAHYLLTAKRADGLPRDPVARFHLGNGAEIYAVHAGADTSEQGQLQSYGTMVNYRYDLSAVAQNHENFATLREITASSNVRSLGAPAEQPFA